MKSGASRDAEPHGLLRIGLAHALAEGTLIKPIRALTEKYRGDGGEVDGVRRSPGLGRGERLISAPPSD